MQADRFCTYSIAPLILTYGTNLYFCGVFWERGRGGGREKGREREREGEGGGGKERERMPIH